jgi:hypothetical protein
MLRIAFFLIFSIVSGVISTAPLHSGKYCPQSCESIFNYITFNDTDAGLSWKIRKCRSELSVTAIYLCDYTHCRSEDGEVENWISTWRTWCLQHSGNELPDYHDVVDQWTAGEIAEIRRFNATEAVSFPTVKELTLPDDEFFENAFNTLGTATTYYAIFCRSHTPQKRHFTSTMSISCMVGT